MKNSVYKYLLITLSLMPFASNATEYELVQYSTSIDTSDTNGASPNTDSTNLATLQSLLNNQERPSNLPLSDYFDTSANKDISFISHPDIAIKFFNKCKELGGYTSVSFDKTNGFKTEFACITKSGSNANAQWSYSAQQSYGNSTCQQFDSIMPTTIAAPYNNKYGPILSLSSSSTSINNTPYQRYYCKITFPTPIPNGKQIVQINNAEQQFATEKQLCEKNGGKFIIDDYTVPGRAFYDSQYSLYKFALCIFTTSGDVNSQISNSHWSYHANLNEYKDKLGTGAQYSLDKTTNRCNKIFSKSTGTASYLGQALPAGNADGYYTACQFSIKQRTNGEVFQ